jgi:HEAT repeat protein
MHVLRRNWAPLVVLPFLVALGGCGADQAKAAAVVGQEIRELITALTPPPPTSVPVEKSEHFATRKRTLERLRAASQAHGIEALRVYREEPPELPEVRAGLLDIAAHTAPKACEELLVELVTTFGEDLLVRREATELLGECLPERATQVLEPILRERYDGRTYPPEDRMLDAWIRAKEKLREDPVPLVALVATDLQRAQDVRHLATRALGRHDSPLSRQALETLLVESSGNGYIRRIALQSLLAILPRAAFCEYAKRIQSNEADTEFIVVLQSALDANCR